MRETRTGCGTWFNNVSRVDARILYQRSNAVAERYQTFGKDGKIRCFPNMVTARKDVVRNMTKRNIIRGRNRV